LHVAAQVGHTRAAEALLHAGANTRCTDQHGNTPLALAQMKGHTAMVTLLRKHMTGIKCNDELRRGTDTGQRRVSVTTAAAAARAHPLLRDVHLVWADNVKTYLRMAYNTPLWILTTATSAVVQRCEWLLNAIVEACCQVWTAGARLAMVMRDHFDVRHAAFIVTLKIAITNTILARRENSAQADKIKKLQASLSAAADVLEKQRLSEQKAHHKALKASHRAQIAVRDQALAVASLNLHKATADAAKPRSQQPQHRHDDGELPPRDFVCPLMLCLMKDPWTTSVGSTYEKEQIEHWLSKNKTDPKTNKKLTSKKLVPNHSLRSVIRQWRDDHPQYSD
jgi:hypothetical protein